ncbi:condensation domain-containing protein [Mycetohabitans rhizoxinica]|nr:condensation domain-containing protein [Mycetohabitans rhizoxinica]
MPAYAAPLTHPLSTAQTEIWLAQQLHEDSPVYNIAQYTVIHGGFDLALFKVALRQVVAEVDSLHLHFVESEEGLRQYIGSPAWSLSVVDFRAEAEPQAAAEAWMRADYEQPVNILQGPTFSLRITKNHLGEGAMVPTISPYHNGWVWLFLDRTTRRTRVIARYVKVLSQSRALLGLYSNC